MASSRAPSTEAVADADDDVAMRSEDESSNSGSGSDAEERQTEWLATTRQKRSTAGNRLSSLIQQAAAEDDELELLFAEDEDDIGFEDVDDDASDVQMDSSDDDEDQGPIAGAEEFEGEKELQQQVRAERQAKKRKANDGIPAVFKKKVKIDPTAPLKATPPRPKKKSERASWIPTAEELPTRASARSTTRESKQLLHAQMIRREKQRLKQLEVMEKAQKRKEAEKPKAMTQEDRLAEAARMEKQNAKSLNSWEEAEKKREEEQRAKLEALQNRKLQGPYITWWSGMAEWVSGKLKRVGKNIVVEEKHKSTAGRKRKADEMQQDVSFLTTEASQTSANVADGMSIHSPLLPQTTVATEISTADQHATISSTAIPMQGAVANGTSNDEQPLTPCTIPQNALAMPSGAETSPVHTPQSILDGSVPLPGFQNPPPLAPPTVTQQALRLVPSQTTPFAFTTIQPTTNVDVALVTERGTYNSLILENFNENAIKNKDTQCQVLFNRKFPKTQKSGHPVLCAITNYPAKFRDPSTNLPYCNSYAYKEIQKLKRGEYKWSTLLQAYVGQTQYAARGVPPRFIKSAILPQPTTTVAR